MDDKGLKTIKQLALKPVRDLRVIKGLLVDLVEQGITDNHHEDYIFARLTDKSDILDPLGQLRKVYPNTLQLERTEFVSAKGSRLVADVNLKRTEEQVFYDFYKQVIGQDMTDAQSELILEIISDAKDAIEGN